MNSLWTLYVDDTRLAFFVLLLASWSISTTGFGGGGAASSAAGLPPAASSRSSLVSNWSSEVDSGAGLPSAVDSSDVAPPGHATAGVIIGTFAEGLQ